MARQAVDTEPSDAELFAAWRRSRDRRIRNVLVERHRGLAHHFAKRYTKSRIPYDDLQQIALIGLVKAVERFDPDRGVQFATFARPYITGEIRHHFRDAGWELHVPRPVKDLAQQLRGARERLAASLGRDPSPAELAEDLGVDVADVLEALEASRVTRTRSLDVPVGGDDDGPVLDVPASDSGFGAVERRLLLEDLLATLDDRERRILELRYVEEWTQDQIAEEVGVSQVQVSRLIRRSLAELQTRLRERPVSDGATNTV